MVLLFVVVYLADSRIGPPIRNAYLESDSDSYFAGQGQVIFVYAVSYPPKALERVSPIPGMLVFLIHAVCSDRVPLASNIQWQCWERNTKTAASSHQQQTINNLLFVLKHKLANPDTILVYFMRTSPQSAPSRISPRCR